jgi:L-arabinose isomerase
MQSPFEGKSVWFITGSQELYGPETLAQVAAQSQQIVGWLNDSERDAADLPIAVTWQPTLTDSAAILRTVLAANADENCLGLIIWMHTFSPAKMWIRGLDAVARPVLHLHTQANESLPWATLDMDFMNLNQAAHGDREFGYIQTRLGLSRTTVVGHVTHADVRQRIGRWMRAAAGFASTRGMRLARFGDNMRGVAVTEGDKVEAELRFGTAVNAYAVTDLAKAVDDVPDPVVDDLVTAYLDAYDVQPELRPGGAAEESLRYGARLEAGLRGFLEAGDFQAFTTNFEDLAGLRQLPGLAVQRLMADGYGFGGEGDWKTALLLRAVKVMAHGLPGGTSFMEDYTYHLGPGPQRVLGAHMLEVCPTIAAERPSLEVHPLSIGNREDPVRLKFTAAPGRGVVVGMCDLGTRLRLTANTVTVIEPDAPLPNLPVACAVWEPDPSLPVSAECWLDAGAPHHTVLTTAIDAQTVEMFADMVGVELALIDQDATPRGFRNQLRWNQAYFAGAR